MKRTTDEIPATTKVATHAFRNEQTIAALREQCMLLERAIDDARFTMDSRVDLHELNVIHELIDVRNWLNRWRSLAAEIRTLREGPL